MIDEKRSQMSLSGYDVSRCDDTVPKGVLDGLSWNFVSSFDESIRSKLLYKTMKMQILILALL